MSILTAEKRYSQDNDKLAEKVKELKSALDNLDERSHNIRKALGSTRNTQPFMTASQYTVRWSVYVN